MIPASRSAALQVLLALALSVVFLYLFLRDLDIDAVLDSIEDSNYALVPLALLLFALSLLARTWRWQVFYRPETVSFRLLLTVLLTTYAGNNLLPLRGGEILRAQLLLSRASISRMRTIGVAVIERLFDLLVLGACVVAGRLVVDTGLAFLGTGLLVMLASLVGFALAWTLTRHRLFMRRITGIGWLPLRQSWRNTLNWWSDWVIDGFYVVRSLPSFLLAVLLTALAWSLEFGMYWVVAEAFHINESLLTIAFVGALANLALSIPSAQGGVGPFQLAAKEGLLKFGVSSSVGAAYALTLHVLLIVPVTAVGVAVFLWQLRARKQDQDVLATAPEV